MSTTERRTFGRAWHRRVAGLHVMKLAGTDREMGLQHGTLLREAVPRGPIPYYRDYVGKLMRQIGIGAAAPVAWWALKQTLGRRVARDLPPFAKAAIAGLAEGAGLPESEVLEGCVMPDCLMWAASRVSELSRVADTVRHRVALELGCTSALAWGDATTDGKLLHARNFDYHGVSRWAREAAVIFHAPDDGQRYVSVSAAGILLGGVTAMNEAGLTLTVHQHMMSTGSRLGGLPVGVVGDLVMRHAETLEDAARILDEHAHIGCWTHIVADGNSRRVLCHEQNASRRVAHRPGPRETTFGYANVYLDPELASTERDLYGSYWRANTGRHARARELLRQGHGRLDPTAMAAVLADTGGEGCRLRRPISMLLTVGSVVFKPEDGVVWVATGEAPVSQNAFEPFSLGAEDHAPEHGALTAHVTEPPQAREAFGAYRDAYLAYFDQRDPDDSRRLIGRALRLAPHEPLYHALDGFLALQTRSPAEALQAFEAALALGHPDPERRATLLLWRARAHDLLGHRDAATTDYAAVLASPRVDPPVRKAADAHLRKPYTPRAAARLHIDFAYADVVAP